MRKQTKMWTQRDGTKIRICDMANTHLMHTLRMLWRLAVAERSAAIRDAHQIEAAVSAEMASFYAAQDTERAETSSVEDFMPDIFFSLQDDAYRRGLVEVPDEEVGDETVALIASRETMPLDMGDTV